MQVISDKLQVLSKQIYEATSFSLFSELPLEEIEAVMAEVSDHDSLRSRLNDLSNIIDRIDKKNIDKYTSIKADGSKQSLINLFKIILPESHDRINTAIEDPLDIIFLIRAYFTHGKNRNINKAFTYLEIDSNTLNDHKSIWGKVLALFGTTLDSMIEMLRDKEKDYSQDELDESTKEMLLSLSIKRAAHKLRDPDTKKVLLFLLSENKIVDSTLANHFRMTTDALRTCLLSLYPSFIAFKYHNDQETIVSLQKEIIEPLKSFYFQEEKK